MAPTNNSRECSIKVSVRSLLKAISVAIIFLVRVAGTSNRFAIVL